MVDTKTQRKLKVFACDSFRLFGCSVEAVQRYERGMSGSISTAVAAPLPITQLELETAFRNALKNTEEAIFSMQQSMVGKRKSERVEKAEELVKRLCVKFGVKQV